jgi:hypothetical protein
MPTIEQIVQSIDTQLDALLTEQAQLADARAALAGSPRSVTQTPAPTRTRKRASKPKQPKSKGSIGTDELLKLVRDSPGLTTTTLAKLANAEQGGVLALLKDAEKDGAVKREGQRRATRWYRYADEDRIRERAAELERQRKPQAGGGR